MKIADYRLDYYERSSKASEIARQLSFAGIALIWVFKPQDATPIAIPSELLMPAIFFVAALGLDLLHATSGALIWGAFARYHEKRHLGADQELDAPAYFNWPILAFFWSKIVAVIAAYALTFAYIWSLHIKH